MSPVWLLPHVDSLLESVRPVELELPEGVRLSRRLFVALLLVLLPMAAHRAVEVVSLLAALLALLVRLLRYP